MRRTASAGRQARARLAIGAAPQDPNEHEGSARRRVGERRERPGHGAPGHRHREDRQPPGAAPVAPVRQAPPAGEPERDGHVLRQVTRQVAQSPGRRGPEQPCQHRHPGIREAPRQQEQEAGRDPGQEDRRECRKPQGRSRRHQQRIAGRVLGRQRRRHENVVLLEEFRQGRRGRRPVPGGEDPRLEHVRRLVVAERDGMERSAHEHHLEGGREAEHEGRRFRRQSPLDERDHAPCDRAETRAGSSLALQAPSLTVLAFRSSGRRGLRPSRCRRCPAGRGATRDSSAGPGSPPAGRPRACRGPVVDAERAGRRLRRGPDRLERREPGPDVQLHLDRDGEARKGPHVGAERDRHAGVVEPPQVLAQRGQAPSQACRSSGYRSR